MSKSKDAMPGSQQQVVLRVRELERALRELCDWINNEYAVHPAAFDEDTTPNAAWRTLVNPAIKEKAQNDQAQRPERE